MEPGFVFWGLFVALGAIVVGYLIWMYRTERSRGEGSGPVRRSDRRRSDR